MISQLDFVMKEPILSYLIIIINGSLVLGSVWMQEKVNGIIKVIMICLWKQSKGSLI